MASLPPAPPHPKLANAQRRVCTYTDFLSHNSYSVGHGAMQSTQIDSEVYKFPEIMHKIYWYVCTCILMMSWTSWKFKIYQQTMLGNSESIFSRMDYSVAAIIIEKGYIIVNLILCVWQPQLIVTDSHIVSDHLHMKLGLYFVLDSIWLDGKGVFLNLNSWYLLFFTALFHNYLRRFLRASMYGNIIYIFKRWERGEMNTCRNKNGTNRRNVSTPNSSRYYIKHILWCLAASIS